MRRLVEGAEQQVGAGEQNRPPDVTAYDPQTTKEGQKEPEDRQAGEKTERIITGAEQQVGTGEQRRGVGTGAYDPRATKEEDAELDDALEEPSRERPAVADIKKQAEVRPPTARTRLSLAGRRRSPS